MGCEWSQKSLGEILKFANGKSSPDRSESGEFVVYGSNGPIGRASLSNAPDNTIVVGRVGSYCGSTYLVRQRCWVTDNAIRANPKGENDVFFAFYLLLPILYARTAMPEQFRSLMDLHPFTFYAESSRALLLDYGNFSALKLLSAVAIALLTLLIGYLAFRRLDPHFEDFL